jgi:TRAP transporter TAXI family solute receptor
MFSTARRLLTGSLYPWLAVGVLGAGFAVLFWFSRPVALVIAAGSAELNEPKVVQALVDALAQERSPVRLTVLTTGGPFESAQAIAEGKADVALTRSDIALAQGATSVVALRKFYPVLISPKASKITKMADLRGKRVGIASFPAQNLPLAQRVLQHWGLKASDYLLLPLEPPNIEAALADKRLDAFFAIAAAGSRPAGRFIDTLRAKWGKDFQLLPFDEVSALVSKIPGLEAGEIPKGYFGGEPARPEEDLDTIALSNRIVVSSKVSDDTAATLTRHLLALRDKKQAQLPELLTIGAPVRDNPTLPVNPGSAQIFDGTYQNFVDRYTNHFYISLAILGGLGSIVGTHFRRGRAHRRTQVAAQLHEVLRLGDEVAKGESEHAVRSALNKVDEILQETLMAGAHGDLNAGQVSAMQAAVARCHRAADLQSAFRQL